VKKRGQEQNRAGKEEEDKKGQRTEVGKKNVGTSVGTECRRIRRADRGKKRERKKDQMARGQEEKSKEERGEEDMMTGVLRMVSASAVMKRDRGRKE
jgi:hypothetical protein